MRPSTLRIRGSRHQASPTKSAGPWTQLRNEYVGSASLSLRALAAARGVSYDALKRRARLERWASARAERLCEARHRRDLEELARACADARNAARQLLALPADAALGEVAEVARELHFAAGRAWDLARVP